jgi:hypothetical protein
VDPRGGLDDLENKKFLTLPGLELRPLSRPAHSQSLYRLRYPGSDTYGHDVNISACSLSAKKKIGMKTNLKRSNFWNITPRTPLKVNRSFGGTCRLHLQGLGISQASNQGHISQKCRLTFKV